MLLVTNLGSNEDEDEDEDEDGEFAAEPANVLITKCCLWLFGLTLPFKKERQAGGGQLGRKRRQRERERVDSMALPLSRMH